MRASIRTSMIVLAALGSLACTAPDPEPMPWNVDAAHTEVNFTVKHFFTPVTGSFNEFDIDLHFDPENPVATRVSVRIPVESVNTGNQRRDDHLRSADFFDVAKYKTIRFKSTSVSPGKGNTYAVDGELTLLAVTKPITVTIVRTGSGKDRQGNGRAGIACHFGIKRSDFGMGKMLGAVGDQVDLMIAVEAVGQ